MLTKKTAMTGLIAGAGLVLALPMGPATAKGGGDDRVEVSSEGQCSGTARWELKAKERDGGVEVEFEVDSNVVGQEWAYTLSGPDGILSSGTRTTTGPSGSFSVEVKTGGSANDTFVGQATFGDQECTTGVNAGVGDDDSDDDSSDDKGKDDKGKDDKVDDKGKDKKKVLTPGTCSAGSEITLKVRQKSKKREAELEVDSNVKRQRWNYTISRDGNVIKSGVKKTKGRSGSFSVEVKTRAAGAFTATAERVDGSENCSV